MEVEPMSYKDSKKHVEELIKKAADAKRSEDAMRFSQSACNAGNAIVALANLPKEVKEN